MTPLPKNSIVPSVRMQKPQKIVACMSPGQKSFWSSLAWPRTFTMTEPRRAGTWSHRAAGLPISISRMRKAALRANSATATTISA